MQNILSAFTNITKRLLKDEKENPVAPYIPAEELFSRVDIALQEKGISDAEWEAAIGDLVMKTPRTATTAFFNQLFGGRNEKAVLGDLLAVILNNSMYTYKAGGPQIGVEKEIIRQISNMIGWQDAPSDGTLAPGGSMTNYMAMVMARDAFDKSIPYSGVTQKMTVYTSKESHYSIPKNAAFAGIGRDQVRFVQTDAKGCMDMAHLKTLIKADIENGFAPIMVNCTAGTTVLGAFDQIPAAKTICTKYGLWLHLDGAYCGSVIFSKKYKHLIKGVELLDSFSVNAHKMLGTPLSCSIIIVQDKKHLYDSFSNNASYLYQTHDDEMNPGKISLQCGRRNDALKFWTLWKSVGTEGLEAIVDHQFDLAQYARDYIRNHNDYQLYSYDDSVSVCFNYKGIPAEEICTGLYEHSEMMVGYGTFREDTFIRFVTINAQNKKENILDFFKTLEAFVAKQEMAKSKSLTY